MRAPLRAPWRSTPTARGTNGAAPFDGAGAPSLCWRQVVNPSAFWNRLARAGVSPGPALQNRLWRSAVRRYFDPGRWTLPRFSPENNLEGEPAGTAWRFLLWLREASLPLALTVVAIYWAAVRLQEKILVCR